ncbi:MAG: hypothetical protein P8X57_07175 [Cyclobacteriaceae bacterium]
MKTLYTFILLAMVSMPLAKAQSTNVMTAPSADSVKIDTVLIEVGSSSILFIIRDKADLAKIQAYDLNTIVDELHLRLDPDAAIFIEADTLPEPIPPTEPQMTSGTTDDHRSERPRGINHYFNIDLGMNNYLSPDGFPDESNAPYTVRPWGSWYIALGSVNETYLSRGMSLQFGANISWYNFKFQEDDVYVIRGEESVEFPINPYMLDANFKKSKLTVAYVNISLVPVFHFGKKSHNGWQVWHQGPHSGFRFGVGGYAGYRIGSYHKIKYNDGNTEKRNDHDSFYLENFRYGLRFQLGFGDTDLFVNYDLNSLFREDRGPELNAFSFGIVF